MARFKVSRSYLKEDELGEEEHVVVTHMFAVT